jgi:hypothetical protein
MTDANIKSEAVAEMQDLARASFEPADRDSALSADAASPGGQPPSRRLIPFLVTLAAVIVALPLSWLMWNAYMGALSRWHRRSPARLSNCRSPIINSFTKATC